MRVLAIDWGKKVGMALWDDGKHDAWVVDWDAALDVVMPAYVYSEPTPPAVASSRPDLVVCEDWLISGRSLKSGTSDWKRGRELMLIGATEFACRQTGVPFELQTPSEAFGFCDDEKLRRIGWWTPGLDHSRAASKHLVLALVRHRLIDPRLLLAA